MGATRNTGYLQGIILYDSSNNVGISTAVDPSYKVTLGGSLSGTAAVFSSSVTSTAFVPTGSTIPTNGMYLSAANTLNFATNSANRLSISTSTITSTLALNGTSATFSSSLALTKNSNSGTAISITNTDAGSSAIAEYTLTTDSSGFAAFGKNSSTRDGAGIIDPSDTFIYSEKGNISIFNNFSSGAIRFAAGASSTAQFTIASTGAATFSSSVTATDQIKVTGSGAYLSIYDTQASSKNWAIRAGHDAVGDLAIRQSNSTGGDPVAAGTTRLYINASGNVGIGTNSPEELLELSSSNTTGGQFLMESTGSSTGNYAGMRFKIAGGSDGGYEKAGIFAVRGSGGYNDLSLVFATNTAATTANVTTSDERMRITSGGNVGIGTSSPATLDSGGINLQIKDRSALFQLAAVNSTYLSNNIYYDGTWKRITSGYGAMIRLLNDSNGISFYTTGTGSANSSVTFTEAITIKNDGNVGIGTTTIAWATTNRTVLEVNGTSTALIGLKTGDVQKAYVYHNGTNLYINNAGSGIMAFTNENNYEMTFATNNTERMRITSGGNVSIGGTGIIENTSGWTNLAVNGSTTGIIGVQIGGTNYGSMYGNSANNNFVLQAYGASNNANMIFLTASTERMRITAGGYLKASNDGTYNSSTGSYHEFTNTDSANSIAICRATNSSYVGDGFMIYASRNTTNNTFYALGYYNVGASAYKFRVADSGNVTNTNNSYGQISDIKLKENISDATSKLSDLLKVRIVNFNFKNDNQKQIGVIAQELEQIFPGMIEQYNDKDENGNELGTITKSVKYSVFVPMLIKAIQEQQAQIEELKSKLN